MNLLNEWLRSEPKLSEILSGIDKEGLPAKEAALLACDRVCETYRIAKYPEDISDEYEAEAARRHVDARSVFEELAIINHMSEADEDPRGLMLSALHNVYHYSPIELADVCMEYLYSHKLPVPERQHVYFFGDMSDASIRFEVETEAWPDSGARMMKIVLL